MSVSHPDTVHTMQLSSPSGTVSTISFLLEKCMIPRLPRNPQGIESPAHPAFVVKSTPNKGLGTFAARSILPGQLICQEHPTVVLPHTPLPHDQCALYDATAMMLPEHLRSATLGLVNCRSNEECPSAVEGIARTNAIIIELGLAGGDMYGGIFPNINRCNHSCGPNAAHKWDINTLSLALYAARSIEKGEEITILYVDPTHAREKRIARLSLDYRFLCDCPYCRHPNPKSDESRAALGSWMSTRPGYLKWAKDLCRDDDVVIKSHLEALQLIEEEGLQGMQGIFLEEIALCYAVLGDQDEFKRWGTRVVERCAVEDPQVAQNFSLWLHDQRKFKRWAWRKKQRDQMRGRTQDDPSSPPYTYMSLMF